MNYNGFYFPLFRRMMKKVLAEHYGDGFARDIMKQACSVYKIPEVAQGMMKRSLGAIVMFIAVYIGFEKYVKREDLQ